MTTIDLPALLPELCQHTLANAIAWQKTSIQGMYTIASTYFDLMIGLDTFIVRQLQDGEGLFKQPKIIYQRPVKLEEEKHAQLYTAVVAQVQGFHKILCKMLA